MDKLKYYAVIKFQVLDGCVNNNSPNVEKKFNVNIWAPHFELSRKSFKDYSRERQPKPATTDENIEKLHNMNLDDRLLNVYEKAKGLQAAQKKSIFGEYQQIE